MFVFKKALLVSALVSASCLLFAERAASAEAGNNWPQFRGPGGRGISESSALPEQWSATENVAWKTDIPGRGWSSPIVWGNRVFLTTVVSEGEIEAPKKGLYFGGERKDIPDVARKWMVYCLDLEGGQILWERQVHEGKPAMPIHIKNSYASETPVTDGERVYVYFGNLGLWCFDFEGNQIWTKALEPRQTRFGWGTAASPVLHKDRLYIVNDNEEDSYLLALDKLTGNEVWRVARDEKSNWSTPYVWETDKRTEIVTPGSGLVRSYDLDGNVLWSLKGMSSITISSPYAANGLLYVSSGYVGDKRRPLYAIRPGASGDISLGTGQNGEVQTSNASIAWSDPQGAPYNPTTLVYGERLYVLYDRGFVACFNALDGSAVYERQQIPEAGGFTCSPWAYGDRIFCLNEDGVTFVLKAGDVFELVRKNPLAGDDMGMSTPAIAGDRLLIRSSARVYCIRKGGQG
ncbi:MAG: PQQ-binding-like beta-propeller repeat protein [Candidatus Hydrogenedentales bacterium]|jgi:hypothetical protein